MLDSNKKFINNFLSLFFRLQLFNIITELELDALSIYRVDPKSNFCLHLFYVTSLQMLCGDKTLILDYKFYLEGKGVKI